MSSDLQGSIPLRSKASRCNPIQEDPGKGLGRADTRAWGLHLSFLKRESGRGGYCGSVEKPHCYGDLSQTRRTNTANSRRHRVGESKKGTHDKLTARNTEPAILVGKSGLQTIPEVQRGYFVQITNGAGVRRRELRLNGTLRPCRTNRRNIWRKLPHLCVFGGCHFVETCPKIGKLWGACQMQALGKKRMPHTTTFRLWLASFRFTCFRVAAIQLHLQRIDSVTSCVEASLGLGAWGLGLGKELKSTLSHGTRVFLTAKSRLIRLPLSYTRLDLVTSHIVDIYLRPPAKLESARRRSIFRFYKVPRVIRPRAHGGFMQANAEFNSLPPLPFRSWIDVCQTVLLQA